MKFVIQRVNKATVTINESTKAKIGPGMVVLIGFHKDDQKEDCAKWVEKILKLRIFADENKPINASIQNIEGEVLLVSQFTLYGDLKGQNRPSFTQAAKPDKAREIYNHFVEIFQKAWPKTQTGEFAADMKVNLVNDGPVTIILE